jgi:hypothetical protein
VSGDPSERTPQDRVAQLERLVAATANGITTRWLTGVDGHGRERVTITAEGDLAEVKVAMREGDAWGG